MPVDPNAPIVTQSDIVAGLRSLGLAAGESIMVHSSLSALGNVQGGANAVIDAVLEVIGPKGTVVFPTFTGVAIEFIGKPITDLKAFTGIVPATARGRKDFVSGKHPLYSITAKGPLAQKWVDMEDEYIFPSAEKKWLYDMGQVGGKTMLLGCDHSGNSSIHVACELARLEYKVQDIKWWDTTTEEFLKLPRDKQKEMMDYHMGFKLPYGLDKHMNSIEWPLVEAGALKIGIIGQATVRIMKIADLVRVGVEALKKNPWLLADRLAKPIGWEKLKPPADPALSKH